MKGFLQSRQEHFVCVCARMCACVRECVCILVRLCLSSVRAGLQGHLRLWFPARDPMNGISSIIVQSSSGAQTLTGCMFSRVEGIRVERGGGGGM